ncbi:flagellar basal body P-ring formation chaperone FlgA [Roseovarius aestuarii]|uniref:Flagella basal body P-ring formation protein FlgA n=1 Tax=Roseovarius aestuarii TaxID=475083 RepID=A0A1X7BQA9_9RHOB|nr:flagellar basal body P-ring formation chaperone FlgA [Roseovarius aestuarii]SMC11866.1 flagellar basal body P-ring biosynthesis protein FlgA [Roseovarius aestuarii]
MIKPGLIITCLLFAGQAVADTVLAVRTIRPGGIIMARDVVVEAGNTAGAASDPAEVIGQEARVSLYAGRPIALGNVGPPALVERNQIVPMVFEVNGLRISTEGRSMSRAGAGDFVRVMNLSSRTTVSGRVMPDGRIFVSQ